MSREKIGIVIVVYNEPTEVLKDCLNSVFSIEKRGFDYRIYLVNNCPASAEFRERLLALQKKYPFELITNKENLGFAGGNNVGIRRALSEGAGYILILNPDVIVEKNFLSAMFQVAQGPHQYNGLAAEIKKRKKLGFLGPRIFYLNPKDLIYSNGGIIGRTLTKAWLKDNARNKAELDLKQEPFVTDYVSGTALLVSRDAIEEIGLMREDFFLYYEDTDWALKAKSKGYFMAIVPAARIFHREAVSVGKSSPAHIYYNSRNGFFLARERGSLAIKGLVWILSFWTAGKQIFKILFLPSKRRYSRIILKATFDFWRNKRGKMS